MGQDGKAEAFFVGACEAWLLRKFCPPGSFVHQEVFSGQEFFSSRKFFCGEEWGVKKKTGEESKAVRGGGKSEVGLLL